MSPLLPFRSPEPRFEFHVSRAARARFAFDEAWVSVSGNVLLDDMAATRRLAHRMNLARGAATHPERAVQPGDLHAMGLIDEILHFISALYRQQRRPDALTQVLGLVTHRMSDAATSLLHEFTDEFPPLAVHRGMVGADAWLAGRSEPLAHREMSIEEVLHLWLANMNPAFAPFRELFDDRGLAVRARYADAIAAVRDAYTALPPFGPDNQSLFDMLRAPALAHPDSLTAQLEWIRQRWSHLLPAHFLRRLLITLDVIREEERARWLMLHGAPGMVKGTEGGPDFTGQEFEAERFSPDRDWMPNVVLIAKSTHVWLDQLSRTYLRDIRRLDQVPDEELDRLARRGINGLWLIGLWERSRASAEIKHRMGNAEAAASAYSLYDYAIAGDLGGDDAWATLRERAARRGIRLASDMVPNHTGLDSKWMMEHPDWFLSLDQPPYPAYAFDGPDLSWNPEVGIHLEDHYWDRSDAAVVFKRVDRKSGAARYIYHGNDGTHFPWNDTAQLDYLNPAVREGVIQTILHVARQFPIIRFDAAMTLAKRHYQRLWFPAPGSGGGIPSRAEHGLTKQEFDAAMPEEFWREVVDRVAVEAPDTLLLAEAFWLMEGYFVRTLGMHRVYNSAFMNMLRDEDNAKYRSVIKNTLEFDPEILKRYVNFMNNPDERTALDQFGKDDKYFGVCTLMATLPGLPMFGHGQIEGYAERYGMEFRRPQWDERPDAQLVARHEREIFPLLHRRWLFAEVRDFLLYDFWSGDHVNEDVFAFSNRSGEHRALVVVHNRYAATSGWIRESAAYADKNAPGDGKTLRRGSLGHGLALPEAPEAWTAFRDQVSGLEYLRSCREIHEQGLHFDLGAYDRRVLLDFRVVWHSADQPWADLARELGGRGVGSLDEALSELRLRPVQQAFRALLDADRVRRMAAAGATAPAGELDDVERLAAAWLEAARAHLGGAGDCRRAARAIRERWAGALQHLVTARRTRAREQAGHGLEELAVALGVPLVAAAGARLGEIAGDGTPAAARASWHVLRLPRAAAEFLAALGTDFERALGLARMAGALIEHGDSAGATASAATLVDRWLADADVAAILGVHEYAGVWWFRREAWLEWIGLITSAWGRPGHAATPRPVLARLIAAGEASGWKVETLAQVVRAPSRAKPAARTGGAKSEKAAVRAKPTKRAAPAGDGRSPRRAKATAPAKRAVRAKASAPAKRAVRAKAASGGAPRSAKPAKRATRPRP